MASVQSQPQVTQPVDRNVFRLSIQALGLNISHGSNTSLHDEPATHEWSEANYRHSQHEEVLASPPLTPQPSTIFSPASSSTGSHKPFGPLSSHPTARTDSAAIQRPATADAAGGYRHANFKSPHEPLTPPASQKGSAQNTPNGQFTAIPPLPTNSGLSIVPPINDTPRTYISRPSQSSKHSPEDRPRSRKLLQRRNSASSRSILSLPFRSSVAPDQLLSNEDQAISSSGASVFSQSTRRPFAAASRNGGTGLFCLPIPSHNEPMYSPDGQPLSKVISPKEPSLVPRKSREWFRRPSSIFMNLSSHSTTAKPSQPDSSVSLASPQTPESSYDTHSVAHLSRTESHTSTLRSASIKSHAHLHGLVASSSLPAISFDDGVLTGGDIGGESLFDDVCT